MASPPDPHFVVESLVESLGGSPWVVARRLDDNELRIRNGSMLNGVPIENADLLRAVNEVGEGRDDIWGFFLKNVGDLQRFTVGQTVTLQQSGPHI
jgi:hypothetical protein